MTADELAAAVGAAAAHKLDSALERIQHCLGQLTDGQVWHRSQPGLNSIGNLILHLCGNLRHLEPDFRLLVTVPCRGVIVTSRSADPQFDFVSRAFFPRLGVNEDPVCGSAHCCLVHFWRKRLGKSEFVAFQVSARGGVVKVRVVKDRVFLSGKATTVAKGDVLVEGDES